MKKHYFTKTELGLWGGSVTLITLAFVLFDRANWLTLAASLIGVTSLIFSAKGNPSGQALIVIFSVLYGIISFNFAYYGEMITYLGMTAPMSVFALISWLKNPYGGNRTEVRVNRIHRREVAIMLAVSAAVTVGFYFILKAFGTVNLIPSTLSVTTSFLAVYLTARRCAFFALAYAANDLVLILLWTLAALDEPSYISVIVCFVIFFVNDLYGFINWTKIYRRQNGGE